MRSITAACLLLMSGAAASPRPTPRERAAERALFEKIVEIPTVEGRTAEFKKLTALLDGRVPQGRHHQCHRQGP